jgi:cellulose synthase/poly-beta-1,6-N-acetylglucosamine synthase-like glycosyltransferase
MTHPSVSVVVETVTAREGTAPPPLAEALAGTLNALADQTDRATMVETIVVVDRTIDPTAVEEVRRRFPDVRLVQSSERNYFDAKNAGAAAATGEIVIMLDGDTVPTGDWLRRLLARFDPKVDVVAGRTRYTGTSLLARTCSVPDFANILEEDGGMAGGFNINNVAFRKRVLQEHPLDARIRRNGGCYLLYKQLRAAGTHVVYEPRASVDHGFEGFGEFIRKHFERGFDGVSVYRFDDRAALRGTRYFRRFGAFAIVPLTVRRLAVDWLRLLKHRRQIGISGFAFPYYAAVMTGVRAVEAVGAFTAVTDPGRYRRQDARC